MVASRGRCTRLPFLLEAKLGLSVQVSRASGGARKTREKAGKAAGRKSYTCGNEMRIRLVPMRENEVIEPIKARLIKEQTDYALF